MDAVTQIPPVENEPNRLYEPGSPHRVALQARLAQLNTQGPIDLPLCIDGEWRMGDGVDEPLERPVIGLVPHAGRRLGLLAQDLGGEPHVVAPEVDEFTGGVDLCLEGGLGLAQHGRRVQGVAPRTGQQVGGLEEDRRPVLERQCAPPRRRPFRGCHRGRRVLAVGGLEGA